MGDVLGARIGSDDPEKIAEVRKSVPRILAIGARPASTPKQAPRLGAVYDERGYLQGRYGAIPFLSDFVLAGE